MDLNSLKELRIADFDKKNNILDHLKGFIPSHDKVLFLGYQLTGAQLFIKNLFNPNTLHKRLLINWQTGVGKSIAAISIGNEFIKLFQEQYLIKGIPQMVCILGFNTSETIKADLLKFPELGYITQEESKELNELLLNDDPKYTQFLAMLHKRITNKMVGGYYKFFGYREFINNLFIITDKGISNNIKLQDIFVNTDEPIELEKLISDKFIKVNDNLLSSLKNSIIICDEIHNVYNSLEANNYGLAIQFVLDTLKEDAPRAVFMSATPVTGNASEIIDLLNLLLYDHPKIKRSDYFYKDTEGIFQLKPNALNEITKLTIGKVSFLIDTDVDLYPKRIFVGNSVSKIPYLKFNTYPVSKFHKNTIGSDHLTYSQNIRSVYDIVFPNPDNDSIGLYESSLVISSLQKANKEWKDKIGIDIYNENGNNVITGNFLKKENIKYYSIKYHELLNNVLKLISTKNSGKIMIFHYNVQLSGIILIQELFKMNGFIDEISEPNNSTLCVICGIQLYNHDNKSHDFKPCRFIVAHSNINKITLKRNIAKFNDISNLYGNEIKIIMGSRIIQEGLNFKAIRHQFILSLPINFPILIQVLGRVVRKYSHIDLPEEFRTVHINIYAHDIEIPRYEYKAKEYLVIQEVERAIRINAVDNFINYKKNVIIENTLESLAFKPKNINLPLVTSKYFDAYKYNFDEINILIRLITMLFNIRPVWTLTDLIKSIKESDVNYNTDLIDTLNIELAISKIPNIHNIGKYLIKSDNLDVECYIRNYTPTKMISINLSQYYSKSSFGKEFNNIMESYEEKYIHKQIELSLVELPEKFHIELLKQIVLNKLNHNKIIDLYKRFKILIFNHNKPIGYIDNISVNIYDGEWKNEPFDKYGIERRYDENKIIIGYVVSENLETKLKLRNPISNIKYSDMRNICKGMVCEHHNREDLIELLMQLRKLSPDKSYAHYYDTNTSKVKSYNLCTSIKLYLLFLEEKSRNMVNGMSSGIRWLYLFHDTLPNIAVK